MLPGPAAAVRLSKQHALLENESFAKRARVDGSRLFSLRGVVRAPTAEKQSVRMVGRNPSPHWSCLRCVARKFLHFRPAGTTGQLPHSEKAAQDRSDQAL